MVKHCLVLKLSMLMMLTCHITDAWACVAQAVETPRFASGNSFIVGGDSYRLADMLWVQEGVVPFAYGWIKHKKLKIVPVGKGEADRYGRCAVYLLNEENNHSLQYALVKEGLAIGYNEKAGKYVSALQAAEQQARMSQKGLWQKNVVIQSDETSNHIGSFAIVEGTVKSIYNHKKGHVMLNFGDDWRTDFTVFIPNFSAKKFKKDQLSNIKDKKIEIRGILYEKNGPSISLLNKNYLIEHSK